MSNPLRLLILEDKPDDAELMVRELQRAGYEPDWTRVDTEQGYRDNLDVFVDLILADFVVPQFDGLAALTLMQEQGLDIPFIVVTGSFEELGIACVRQGADDYVIKDRLERLGPAVKRALGERQLRVEKQRVEQVMHEREAHYRMLFDESRDAIIVTNRYGRIIELNPAAVELFGYDLDESPELFERDLHADPDEAEVVLERIKGEGSVQDHPVRLRHRTGREMDCLASWTIRVDAEGAFLGRRGFVRDVSEQVRLERALQACQERLGVLGGGSAEGQEREVGGDGRQLDGAADPAEETDDGSQEIQERLENLD